jgi:hypothetical protein
MFGFWAIVFGFSLCLFCFGVFVGFVLVSFFGIPKHI